MWPRSTKHCHLGRFTLRANVKLSSFDLYFVFPGWSSTFKVINVSTGNTHKSLETLKEHFSMEKYHWCWAGQLVSRCFVNPPWWILRIQLQTWHGQVNHPCLPFAIRKKRDQCTSSQSCWKGKRHNAPCKWKSATSKLNGSETGWLKLTRVSRKTIQQVSREHPKR